MKWLIQKQQKKIDSTLPSWKTEGLASGLILNSSCTWAICVRKKRWRKLLEYSPSTTKVYVPSESFCFCYLFSITRAKILLRSFTTLLRKKKVMFIFRSSSLLENRLLDISNLTQWSCLFAGGSGFSKISIDFVAVWVICKQKLIPSNWPLVPKQGFTSALFLRAFGCQ